MFKRSLIAGVAVAALMAPFSAQAQRAGENAVTSAEDSFGSSIGDQNVGLYSDTSARGFSPVQAGNIRLDGLYFDQQFNLGGRIDGGTTMRVGLSAQSYPFPAPTGIADVTLRRPGDTTVGSLSLARQAYGGQQAEADIVTPLIPGKLGMVASLAGARNHYDWRGTFKNVVFSGALDWAPSDTVNVYAFVQGMEGIDGEAQPLMFTAGVYTPPKYDRSIYFGQWWADRNRSVRNFGALINAEPADGWRFRAGLFRSVNDLKEDTIAFFRNVQPDGAAQFDIVRSQPQFAASTSGEARLTRVIAEGPRLHTFHLAAKGRSVYRRFGGSQTIPMGPAQIGVYRELPEPIYNLGPTSDDDVFQITPGIAYIGRWLEVGEFSAGIQKSFYTATCSSPTCPKRRPAAGRGSITRPLRSTFRPMRRYTRATPADSRNPVSRPRTPTTAAKPCPRA